MKPLVTYLTTDTFAAQKITTTSPLKCDVSEIDCSGHLQPEISINEIEEAK